MLRLLIFVPVLMCFQLQAQTLKPSFITGKTTNTLPYLEYGLGSDRLGGAKIGYIDTNVIVKVVDSSVNRYKVQLSTNHFAYLPKAHFKRDSISSYKPFYLSNSWKVYGDSLFDYVVVTLDDALPYSSRQRIDPSSIEVDVYGAITNTNWITQLATAREIKNVTHEQIEDDVFRINISLKHPDHWGYHIHYDRNRLIIRIKRQPSILKLPNLRIAVDAGHGGTNVGASGKTTKISEKDYTLRIAKQLEAALIKEGATVFMTRNKDTSLEMNERWNMVLNENPDLLLSIHLNSSGRDSVQGVSTYYRYIGFRPVTQHILHRLLETGLKEFGNIGSFNFTLNGPTEYPNCLVEVAFLSNQEDEQRLLDPSFHKEVAEKIVEGVKDWLKAMSGE